MTPTTPFYSSKHFYFGLFFGVACACLICWKLWWKDPSIPSPVVGSDCSLLSGPMDVRRIGTDSSRTSEETDELQKLLDDFSAKYVTPGTDPLNGFYGGRIEKCALTSIINSTDSTEKYLSYKLGLDSDNRVVLLLKGGYNNPFTTTSTRLLQPLILLNGTDRNLFCPLQCDRDRWLLP